MGLGPPELLIILVIVMVLFGGAKLPQLARSLGEAKSEFEKTARDGDAPRADPGSELVTMSKTDLDALLAERGPPTPKASGD